MLNIVNACVCGMFAITVAQAADMPQLSLVSGPHTVTLTTNSKHSSGVGRVGHPTIIYYGAFSDSGKDLVLRLTSPQASTFCSKALKAKVRVAFYTNLKLATSVEKTIGQPGKGLCQYGNLDITVPSKSIFQEIAVYPGGYIQVQQPSGTFEEKQLVTYCHGLSHSSSGRDTPTDIKSLMNILVEVDYERSIRPGSKTVDTLKLDVPLTIHCQ